MEKTLKISVSEDNQNLTELLKSLPETDYTVLKQSKLSGNETVVLITAILKLTETVINILPKILSEIKKGNSKIELSTDGKKIDFNNLSENEIQDKLKEIK